MEFFERAHVKSNSVKKDTKSDITIKKQLKQMLHGYKENDNKLIKTCIRCKSEVCDPQQCFEDSSSVSGFSDLNLTNSSSEGISQATFNSQSNEDSIKDEESKVNQSTTNDDFGDSIESISEFSDDIKSSYAGSQDEVDNLMLKDDIDTDTDMDIDQSIDNLIITSDDSQVSLSSSLDHEILTSHGSESEFDPDGALASKILEKLSQKETKSKKGRKRKLAKRQCDTKSVDDSIQGVLSNSDEEYEFHDSYFTPSKSDSSTANDRLDRSEENSSQDSTTSTYSSPFISITANNLPNESLSKILGDYRHPTVRNLPCEKQHVLHSNLCMFSIEDMSIDNVEVDEDASSIVPEIDDDQSIQDLDNTDNNVTAPNEENASVYDDTIISESAERESVLSNAEVEQTSPVKMYTIKKTCIFVIKHPGKMYIHGKVRVKTLGGAIEACGYIIKDEWCNIYAPNYSYAQCLETVKVENTNHGLFSKLTAMGLSVSNTEEIITTMTEYDGVIAMSCLEDRKMDFVDNNFTVTDIFGKPSKDVDSSLKQASELLGCSLYIQTPYRALETSPIWDSVVECGLEPESRGVITGGKGAGKSTFLRYCVNRLLSKGPVLVIDLDPGQAEFTVAGNVSATIVDKPLLGMKFTHLRKPERMLHIGIINTMDNAPLYIDAINSLITYCKNDEKLKNMAWVVNTMGMCNNIGLKFMAYTILKVNPTYLLQLDSKKDKKRFETHLRHESITRLYYTRFKNDYLFKNIEINELYYKFFVSNSLASSKSIYSLAPREERYLNFLAYFGELLNIHTNCRILDIVPYEVNLKDLNVVTNVNVPVDAIAKVINGKIVALCVSGGESGAVQVEEKPLPCLGYGLVRGIDGEKGVLYVLTPEPVGELCQADTVAYSDWAPELRGLEGALPAGTAVPFRTVAPRSQRQLMFPPKRRFNPLQLLKMSRTS